MRKRNPLFHGTTVLSVRRGDRIAMGADGQVTLGETIVKRNAVKVRWLADRKVLVGFAGSAADAMSLVERFEDFLNKYGRNTLRAATELAKLWRTDRALRRLESVLAVADTELSLLVSGTGDVIEPSDGVIGIGSGGAYAAAAARALLRHSELPAAEIVRESLGIAAELCVYTNSDITVEELCVR
jgi:ATP-dependent HslUV protease subunit HslV